MPRLKGHPRAPSLTSAIVGFVVLGTVLAGASSWYLLSQRGAEFREAALAEAVTARAKGLQLDFSRALYEEWRAARTIANDIAGRDPLAVRSSLDLVVGDSSRVSWAGIAGIDGILVSASRGLLEGQDVSQRPWFQRGLEGDFAGDVHDALLLAQLLPARGGEPRRFLDLATPVKDRQGAPTGVLGLHLDEAWALEHLRESAVALAIDVFILNREGKVVMGTSELPSSIGALPSARAAMAGVSATGVELWPDGTSYLTTVIPQVGYQDLPSFGWSMIARIDNGAVGGRASLTSLLLIPAVVGGLLMIMTGIFVLAFARPFAKLAASATSIMGGHHVYPYESHSTAEAYILSAAIAQLQGRSNQRAVNGKRTGVERDL